MKIRLVGAELFHADGRTDRHEPKMIFVYLQPFITPVLSRFISARLFSVPPKLKMKLKRLHFADVAGIQEAVTDELKKVQEEEFSAVFSETVRPRKSPYGAYFEFKKNQSQNFWTALCRLLTSLKEIMWYRTAE
jgi:hypothetical protein